MLYLRSMFIIVYPLLISVVVFLTIVCRYAYKRHCDRRTATERWNNMPPEIRQYHSTMTEVDRMMIDGALARNREVGIPVTLPVLTSNIPETLCTEPLQDIVPLEVTYKNIAVCNDPLEWWPCKRKDLPGPSPAEQMIIDELRKWKVKWYREVSFSGLSVTGYSYPRYDILVVLPGTPSGICIIEYDSALYHRTPHQKGMDRLKTRFCRQHSIPLHRYNTKHYWSLPAHIATLMKEYDIKER